MRFVRYFCCFAVLILASSQVFGWRWYLNVKRWYDAAATKESETYQEAEVEAKVFSELSYERQATSARRLEQDEQLHQWLNRRIDAGGAKVTDDFLEQVRAANPHYLKIAGFATQSTSIEGLLEQVQSWSDHTEGGFTHQTVSVRARPARLGYDCIVLAGRRLPDFVPEAMAPGQDVFFSTCSLCGKGQPCEIPRRSRSVSLECPNCHRVFAMIAPDTKGTFHHMSDYLTGYAPPAHFPDGISRYDEMVLIWKTVTSSVRYLPDSPAGTDEVDTWQFALETQMLGTGDCEDSAILLADWLMTRGFDARVSLGRFAEQGGHAWVVVRLDGKSYLLEATNPYLDTATPPLAADVGSRYVAESQLDRDGFFVRARPKSLWDGDYFTASKWIHVKTPHTIVQTGRYPIAAIPAWFGRSATP